MTFTESFLKELEREAITTRKMLKLVPDDKYSWKPHEKSMTMQVLATHIAELPEWIGMVLNTEELDFAQNEYKPTILSNNAELMSFFEAKLALGKIELAKAADEKLKGNWTIRSGEQILFVAPKDEMLRSVFCQVVHHRAQLGVYLRLLNIPIPGSYGPSADEQNFS
jgi:uncharacterized damage-inducible protein DinB